MSRNLLFLFAGAISVVAFSPFNLWWMAIISLSLLLLLLYSGGANKAFFAGYLYGLGFFGAGTSWIFNSLYDFGNAPWIAAVAITLAGILVLSLFPAAVCRLYVQFGSDKKRGLSALIIFSSLWVLFEWLRSWVLTGFPWLLMGHTLVDSPLSGVIPVLGVFGGSAIIAILSYVLFCIAISPLKGQIKLAVFALLLISPVILMQNIEWTSQDGERVVKVSAVQANIPFAMKWDKSRRNEVYQAYVDLTRQHWDSDIIVWPETAIPTFHRVANQDFIPIFETELRENNVELISGVFTYEPHSERIFNSLVTLGTDDVQIYSKQHLVPFGEYLPLRWLFEFFRYLVTIPMSDLSAGSGPALVNMQQIPIGVSICYEAAYGEEINQALPEAQLLINVTNDAWFGDSLAPHQHLQIARTRSLETGRYMVRAANTGISAIIDNQGKIISQSVQFVDDVVTAQIKPMTGSTPFTRWGNWAIISSLSALLLLILLTRRQSSSRN